MQVTAVSTNIIGPFRNNDDDIEQSDCLRSDCTAKSSLKKQNVSSVESFDTINEWKNFCQIQILAKNIDYIA